ncbi:hypothetical protein V2G26_019750 [Clonostachys chloroleuca]
MPSEEFHLPEGALCPLSSAWTPHLEYWHGWITWDDHRGSSWHRLSRRRLSQMLSTDRCPDDTWGSLKACPSIPPIQEAMSVGNCRTKDLDLFHWTIQSSRASDSWYNGTTPRRVNHSIGKTIYSDYVQSAHCSVWFEH